MNHAKILIWLSCAALFGALRQAGAAEAAPLAYTRSVNTYQAPAVTLLDQHGKPTQLGRLLESAQPVLLQFVFTSCSTVCPVQAAVFSSAQATLDRSGQPYRMISISIDPEQDSTAQLRQFATKFKAGPHWRFLTGTPQDIGRVLKAFGAALPVGNKMFHQPLTFLHAGQGTAWVRLDGMLSLAELQAECAAAFGAPVLAARMQAD